MNLDTLFAILGLISQLIIIYFNEPILLNISLIFWILAYLTKE